MMLTDYIKDICEILKIEIPQISHDVSHFQSDTMLAQCDSKGTTIYVKEIDKVNLDSMFAIAHELRHIWQIRTDYDMYFSKYKTVDELGVEDYNNQLAEIDANAFAYIVMVDYFKVKPLYNGLSEDTIKLIKCRVDYIVQSLK